ncbi:hypothetical protein FA95DRAFT_1502600, partial [Auriscalpium vulgare]
DFAQCTASTLWNGDKAYVKRNSRHRLVFPDDEPICIDWQRSSGCRSSGHQERHRWSGCGSANHGAARCSRAEKA